MTKDEVKKLDKSFGLYMRRKHMKCGICGSDLDDTAQVSHCFGRASLSVRWDERNCYLVHDKCHRKWERMGSLERLEWLEEKLGAEETLMLRQDASSSRKYTNDEVKEMIERFKV